MDGERIWYIKSLFYFIDVWSNKNVSSIDCENVATKY